MLGLNRMPATRAHANPAKNGHVNNTKHIVAVWAHFRVVQLDQRYNLKWSKLELSCNADVILEHQEQPTVMTYFRTRTYRKSVSILVCANPRLTVCKMQNRSVVIGCLSTQLHYRVQHEMLFYLRERVLSGSILDRPELEQDLGQLTTS